MASIKRELQVKFSTTGDGQVVRKIVQTDDALKGAADSGGKASQSIGQLSEALDQKLEGSVGKAFKATDRLNSIVGQVTGAIGLAGLAVSGIIGAYKLLTAGSDQAAKAQKIVADRIKAVKEEAAAAARKVNELAAAQGGSAGFLSGPELAQLQDAEKRRTALLADRERLTARALKTQEKLARMTGGMREQSVSVLQAERRELEARLDFTQGEIQLLGQVAAARRRAALAFDVQAAATVSGAKAVGEAMVETTTQTEKRIRGVFAPFEDQIGRVFALRSTDEQFAGFAAGLEGLVPVAMQVGDAIRDALSVVPGIGLGDGEIQAVADETASALDAAREQVAAFGDTAARSMAGAAAATLVYGGSLGEVASQAIASLAAQATTEALFQTAKGLAYLAESFFNPAAAASASTAFASAAAFGAIAAVTVPVARASGSASQGGGTGSGVPAGPSSRDVGRTDDAGGGGETVIINMGNQRVFATERDVGSAVARSLNEAGRGRGRPRIRRAAIGRA